MRFDALAGYCRRPQAKLVTDELGYYEECRERVLGILIRDSVDEDFSSITLARDRRGRFRAIHVPKFTASRSLAFKQLQAELAKWSGYEDTEYYQGDETGPSLDFFTPIVDRVNLDPLFGALTESPGNSPARAIIAEMMHYFEDPDGNFVQQFQTTGFSPRLWELYLFALFTELNYHVDRSFPVPDFLCSGLIGRFFVEAVSVNPTLKDGRAAPEPVPDGGPEWESYSREYVPIKFGSALYSKLRKRYWTQQHVAGLPILLAIQDFHFPGSMTRTTAPLIEYLYGVRHASFRAGDGRLLITANRVESHTWKDKQIPSGFFFQPEAENISAVLANPHGTISKFNRMGFLAGFGSRLPLMIRKGLKYNWEAKTEEPAGFTSVVNDVEYSETWVEGLSVYHNPRALHPIPFDLFPGAAHHVIEDELITSHIPDFFPFSSRTFILTELLSTELCEATTPIVLRGKTSR
jgi:hypothetical protein